MKAFAVAVVLCYVLFASNAFVNAATTNLRPIIGILTQPTGSGMSKYGQSYIAASYVKVRNHANKLNPDRIKFGNLILADGQSNQLWTTILSSTLIIMLAIDFGKEISKLAETSF